MNRAATSRVATAAISEAATAAPIGVAAEEAAEQECIRQQRLQQPGAGAAILAGSMETTFHSNRCRRYWLWDTRPSKDKKITAAEIASAATKAKVAA